MVCAGRGNGEPGGADEGRREDFGGIFRRDMANGTVTDPAAGFLLNRRTRALSGARCFAACEQHGPRFAPEEPRD